MSEVVTDAIAKLERLLRESDDFSEIGNAFYDLVEIDAFLDMGAPKENPRLAGMLAAGAEKLFQQPCSIPYSLFVYVPEFDFYHGPAFIESHSANIFYFAGIDLGMLIVDAGKTHFLRLSAIVLEGPAHLANPEEPASD